MSKHHSRKAKGDCCKDFADCCKTGSKGCAPKDPTPPAPSAPPANDKGCPVKAPKKSGGDCCPSKKGGGGCP